jgi:hypothetical protein
MSFEYSLEFDGQAPISAIVDRLGSRGLSPRDVRADGAVLAYPSTPDEQVLRWGGDVEISTIPTGLLVTMTTNEHRQILQDIIDELGAHGLSVVIDEP